MLQALRTIKTSHIQVTLVANKSHSPRKWDTSWALFFTFNKES